MCFYGYYKRIYLYCISTVFGRFFAGVGKIYKMESIRHCSAIGIHLCIKYDFLYNGAVRIGRMFCNLQSIEKQPALCHDFCHVVKM